MDPDQHYQAQQYQLAVGYQQHYQQHYGHHHHHYHHAHHSQQQQQQLQSQSQHSGGVGATSPVHQTAAASLSSHYQPLGYSAIVQHHPDHVTASQHHLNSPEHQHQHLHQAPQPQQHQHQHQLLHQHQHQQQHQDQHQLPQQALHQQQEQQQQQQHLTLDHQFKIETPPNFRSSASNVDDDTGGGGGGAGIFSSNCSTSTSTSGGSSISSGSSHLDQFDPQQESSSSLAATATATAAVASEAEPRAPATDEPAGANAHRISMVKDVNIEQRSSHIIVIDVKSGRKEVLTNDQLTTSPVRLLNKTLAGFPKKTITRIKQLRRTLKNRGYAQICRTKRLDQKNKLERRNSELMDENRRKDQRIAELEKRIDHLLETLHHNANVNANVATALGECGAGHHHHEFREQHFR